jgi:hypothetical protein
MRYSGIAYKTISLIKTSVMKLIFFILFLFIVSNLSVMAQKQQRGHTVNISGETVEVKIPGKNKQAEGKDQIEEIKQVENSIQNELKIYTLEMQDRRFISDNVITEVHADINRINKSHSLSITYSYSLLNDSIKFKADDFGLGKYLLKESNALQVTLAFVKKNIEGELAKYFTVNREISITINGSADATPIGKVIPYKGEFGEQLVEDCDFEGKNQKMEVSASQGIINNQTLAFLRSYAVRDYLENNIFQSKYPGLKYHYIATVSGQRGGKFRRVSIEMVIYNAFK